MSEDKKPTGLRRTRGGAASLRAAAVAGRAAPVAAVAPKAKPVRLNSDMDPELYKWLRGFALQADSDVSKVVRAVLAELRDSDDLAAKIKARL